MLLPSAGSAGQVPVVMSVSVNSRTEVQAYLVSDCRLCRFVLRQER